MADNKKRKESKSDTNRKEIEFGQYTIRTKVNPLFSDYTDVQHIFLHPENGITVTLIVGGLKLTKWPEPDEIKIIMNQDVHPFKKGNYIKMKGLFIKEGRLEDSMKSKIHAPHLIGEDKVADYAAAMTGISPTSLIFQVACSFVPKPQVW